MTNILIILIKWYKNHKLTAIRFAFAAILVAVLLSNNTTLFWKNFTSSDKNISFKYPNEISLKIQENRDSTLNIYSYNADKSQNIQLVGSDIYFNLLINKASDSEIKDYVENIDKREKVQVGNISGYKSNPDEMSSSDVENYLVIHRGNLFNLSLVNPRSVYYEDKKGVEIFHNIINTISFY